MTIAGSAYFSEYPGTGIVSTHSKECKMTPGTALDANKGKFYLYLQLFASRTRPDQWTVAILQRVGGFTTFGCQPERELALEGEASRQKRPTAA